MKIDLNRLRTDVKTRTLSRAVSPIGRVKTGATEVIRANLVELLKMRDEGASWPELAAGLAAQGLTQGDNEPLTGRRLTALINNIKVRDAKLAKTADRRAATTFAVETPSASRNRPAPPKRGRVTLSPDMHASAPIESHLSLVDEQELRVAELERHAHLLKRK